MAGAPEIGQKVADFALPGGVWDGREFTAREYRLSQAAGHPLILAFYPGDDTSVCTKQLCSYSSGFEAFEGLDARVWGISPQDVTSHEAFARKYGLRMPLLADTGREVARAFGIAVPGLGLRRAVFLIGPDGVLRWKHVALLGATFQSVDTLTEKVSALSAG